MRFQWANKGEANSRLFHRLAFRRHRKSLIKELELKTGGVSRNIEMIASEILVFMQSCLLKVCLVDHVLRTWIGVLFFQIRRL